MTIKLFFDLMSQPSRALYIFFNQAKIPFEPCLVALRTGEHLTAEFKTKNRFQKVPFIHDDNFKLSESVAIVRYVSAKHHNDWYPSDRVGQAKVDEYLEWQHNNTRAFCAMYFQKKWLIPLMTGAECDPKQVAVVRTNMEAALDTIESVWLAETPFLIGDKISVADLYATCEIEQLKLTDYEPARGRPRLGAWMERVRRDTNPVYDEAHKIINRIAQNAKKAKL